jgi:hypothetical protein
VAAIQSDPVSSHPEIKEKSREDATSALVIQFYSRFQLNAM